jgi:hypothetical protein
MSLDNYVLVVTDFESHELAGDSSQVIKPYPRTEKLTNTVSLQQL